VGFLSTYDALQDPREQIGLLEQWIVESPDAMFDELRREAAHLHHAGTGGGSLSTGTCSRWRRWTTSFSSGRRV
jgi:hypothetical protein